jgi:hypothetical protein
MRKSEVELQAAVLVNGALTLALAWPKDGLIMAFSRQYSPMIQKINKAVPLDKELAEAVDAEYRRVSGQLPRT